MKNVDGPRLVELEAESTVPAMGAARALGAEPAAFLLLLDLLSLVTAFWIAYTTVPFLKDLFLSHSPIRGWLAALDPEPAGKYRPINESAWMLLVMAPIALLCQQVTGAYRPLLVQ